MTVGEPGPRAARSPHLATKWLRDGSWWAALAGGAIAFPIAVLLHELGHFAGYSVFGFRPPLTGSRSRVGPLWVLWLGPQVLP